MKMKVMIRNCLCVMLALMLAFPMSGARVTGAALSGETVVDVDENSIDAVEPEEDAAEENELTATADNDNADEVESEGTVDLEEVDAADTATGKVTDADAEGTADVTENATAMDSDNAVGDDEAIETEQAAQSAASVSVDTSAASPEEGCIADDEVSVVAEDDPTAADTTADPAPASEDRSDDGADDGTEDSDIASDTAAIEITDSAVTLSSTSYTYNGTEKKPKVTVEIGDTTLISGTDYSVTYANNTKAGTAFVTVTGTGACTGTVTKSFTIGKASISSASVSLSTGSYTYNETARKPTLTVKLVLNGSTKTLTKGTDYSVSYTNNTNAGTATVKISGVGNYKGSKTKSFTIKKKSIAKATVTLSKTSYTYNAKAKKPTATVKLTLNGSKKKLTKGTDYTVSYKNNKAIGKATVTVKGKGNYSGSVKKTFTISPAKVKISSLKASGNKKVKVTWKKVAGSVKYQIAYRRKGVTKWTYTKVSSSARSKTLSKLKAGKTYYVKIRAYKKVRSKTYYGSWSSTKSVKTKSTTTTTKTTTSSSGSTTTTTITTTTTTTTAKDSSSSSSSSASSFSFDNLEGTFVNVSAGYNLLNTFRTSSGVWYWNSDNKTKTYFNKSGYTTLGKLTKNSELETTAKQRAVEIAEKYSHTRPDGTSFYTIYPCSTAGENLAYGTGSIGISTIMTLWEEEDEDYSGQGHRRNILNKTFNAVGLACYEVNGTRYYVMALGFM